MTRGLVFILAYLLGFLTMVLLALVGLACVLWTGQAMPPKPKGIGPR